MHTYDVRWVSSSSPWQWAIKKESVCVKAGFSRFYLVAEAKGSWWANYLNYMEKENEQ
jgi:hypothetical protein